MPEKPLFGMKQNFDHDSHEYILLLFSSYLALPAMALLMGISWFKPPPKINYTQV